MQNYYDDEFLENYFDNKSIKNIRSIDYIIAKKLSQKRKSMNMTLEEMAEIVDLSYQQIHKYEIGQSKIPAKLLFIFAQYFKVSIEYFFIEEKPKKDKINEEIIKIKDDLAKINKNISNLIMKIEADF